MTTIIPSHRHRRDDHETSVEGAYAVRQHEEAHRALLLQTYLDHESGLTDEEAATHADLLDTCYWKRCGELRTSGQIVKTSLKRPGRKGVGRMVCVVRPKRRRLVRSFSLAEKMSA